MLRFCQEVNIDGSGECENLQVQGQSIHNLFVLSDLYSLSRQSLHISFTNTIILKHNTGKYEINILVITCDEVTVYVAYIIRALSKVSYYTVLI